MSSEVVFAKPAGTAGSARSGTDDFGDSVVGDDGGGGIALLTLTHSSLFRLHSLTGFRTDSEVFRCAAVPTANRLRDVLGLGVDEAEHVTS